MDYVASDALEAGLEHVRLSPSDHGRIKLIVRRPAVDARELLDVGTLDPAEGLVGDTWSQRGSRRTVDGSAHPDMQLTLMNSRASALVAGGAEGQPLAGDQLHVDLDLSTGNLPAGTRLAMGSAIIEITDQPHTGCQKFAARFGTDALRMVNSTDGRALRLRGANARILVGGTVRTGDEITKLPPPDDAEPAYDLRRVIDAQQRFSTAIASLGQSDLARPTGLPGWTVAHVLAHVARNADSHVRRTQAAIRGVMVEQYDGGYEGRERDIVASAARPLAEVVHDVFDSGAALNTAWLNVPPEAWGRQTRDVGGRERPLSALPGRRWQELEVHLVDLEVGVTHADWSDDFVAVWLPRLRASLSERLGSGQPPGPGVLDEREELAWLYGRLRRDELAVLAPWR